MGYAGFLERMGQVNDLINARQVLAWDALTWRSGWRSARKTGYDLHRHGRRYTRNDLLVRATGRPLDPAPYIAHLTTKYSELYDLH